MNQVDDAYQLALFKEKTKIRSLLIDKKESLLQEKQPFLSCQTSVARTQNKIQAINETLANLDNIHDFLTLASFQQGLLSNKKLITQRHVGIGNSDTYQQIASLS